MRSSHHLCSKSSHCCIWVCCFQFQTSRWTTSCQLTNFKTYSTRPHNGRLQQRSVLGLLFAFRFLLLFAFRCLFTSATPAPVPPSPPRPLDHHGHGHRRNYEKYANAGRVESYDSYHLSFAPPAQAIKSLDRGFAATKENRQEPHLDLCAVLKGISLR